MKNETTWDTRGTHFGPLRDLAICVIFFGIVLCFQYVSGSWRDEFGGYDDEAAHYVTGLMVRDYLVTPHRPAPVAFAEFYYLHYPKVGIGHWPPVLYVLEALWTLVFPPSRFSLMIFMAVLTTLLAYSLYRFLQSDYGGGFAVAAGLILIALPITRLFSGMIMAEIPLTLFSFASAECFANFLKHEDRKNAIGFGIFAALAILTKGSGFALALVPPLAVVFSGRVRLMARFRFWLPALVVLLLCIPWYWATRGMLQSTWAQSYPSLKYSFGAFHFYARSLISTVGLGLAALSILGMIVAAVIPIFRGCASPKWATLLAFILAFGTMACLVPAGLESRFLIPLLPALLAFVAPATESIFKRLSLPSKRQFASLLPISLFVIGGFRLPRQTSFGYGEAAKFFVTNYRPDQPILVASDTLGEGMMISEIALHDKKPRPTHYVLRASKLLADVNWTGSEYRLMYQTPEQIMEFLSATSIPLVALDESVPPEQLSAHQKLLSDTVRTYPNSWKVVQEFTVVRDGIPFPRALRIYLLTGPVSTRRIPIEINLQRMLGKTLELRP
jgi:hypothetical protein